MSSLFRVASWEKYECRNRWTSHARCPMRPSCVCVPNHDRRAEARRQTQDRRPRGPLRGRSKSAAGGPGAAVFRPYGGAGRTTRLHRRLDQPRRAGRPCPGSSAHRSGGGRLVDRARDVEWEARIVASYFRLQKAHRQADAAGRWSLDWEDCNRQFHNALVSDCGSVWLLRLQQQLYAQSVRYRFISFDQPQPPRDGDAEHKALMDACLARNVERARRLTIEHIERTAKAVAAILPRSDAVEDKAASRILQVLHGGQKSKRLRHGAPKAKPAVARKPARPEASRKRNGSRRA